MKLTANRITSLLLSALFLSMTACGGEASTGEETTAASTGDTTTAPEVEEITRANYPDSLPDDLDFGGETVRILSRDGTWIDMEFGSGEETGDVVDDALFARNRSVEEKLNVKLELLTEKAGYNYTDTYKKVLVAGEDAYDIIQAYHSQGIALSHQGVFVNLKEMPYLDFEKPWHDVDYNEAIAVTPDVWYFLQGDFCQGSLHHISAMVYNKKHYENLYGDGDGLYDIVLDGTWTHDKMAKMCTDVYQDLNGNSAVEVDDLLGCIVGPTAMIDHYAYTSGFSLEERDPDGLPVLVVDQSRNVQIMESLNKLFHETTGFITKESITVEDALAKFNEGSMLFFGMRLYITEELRDMKDPYGVIPYPKVDENQPGYVSIVHNSSTLTAVPLTVPADRYERVGAALEALYAESYRKVTPAYYDVALKVKYTQDEQSGQIIDMIRDSMTTDFFYCNSNSLNSVGTIFRTLLNKPNGNYMSSFAKMKDNVNLRLKMLIEG